MGSPSNRPLRTTRIAAVAPTQPTIAEGGGGGACPTTEEEPESGDELGGPTAADDFEPIENNADDFQEPDGDYQEDQAPQEDHDSTRVLQVHSRTQWHTADSSSSIDDTTPTTLPFYSSRLSSPRRASSSPMRRKS